jgi:hypothetical protein
VAHSFECPACGARTRVHAITDAGSMSCERCGHVLRISGAATPPPPPRRGGSVSSGAGAPPPRRRKRGGEDKGGDKADSTGELPQSKRGAVTTAAPSGSVMVGSSAAAGAPAPPVGRRSRSSQRYSRTARVLAWVVALPIALVAVGWPARKAGYLTGQKLLDVIVEHDVGRFVPLLVIVVLWALVTAVLVTLFLEGGHWFAARRAERRAAAS